MVILICLVTTNTQGGIVQYLFKVAEVLDKKGYEIKCFVPDDASYNTTLPQTKIEKFEKVKSIWNKAPGILSVAQSILSFNPDFVWFVDTTIPTCQISLALADKTKVLLTFHDGSEEHLGHDTSIKRKLKQKFLAATWVKAFRKVDHIVFLSEYVKKGFVKKYPQYASKVLLYPLGAHIPNVVQMRPKELGKVEGYLLFFGRTDKYKGLGNLLEAYNSWSDRKLDLVIAGNGTFTESELKSIESNSHVHLLKRYIKDEEMIWLFNNCCAVVLPYIEATQSGIIPIAYASGKPVIVSDVEGLTQFVIDEQTGFVCQNINDYLHAFDRMSNYASSFKDACLKYYRVNMDWQNSIDNLISNVCIN